MQNLKFFNNLGRLTCVNKKSAIYKNWVLEPIFSQKKKFNTLNFCIYKQFYAYLMLVQKSVYSSTVHVH
jgi:hypothetical protein